MHRGQALVLTSASVLPGYGIYGAHAPPYRLNTYDESEAGDNWDWHFIDSMYFTMATLTTVGYGDMPTLPQHMRLITIVFGLVGVLVIAGQSHAPSKAQGSVMGSLAPHVSRSARCSSPRVSSSRLPIKLWA